MLLTGFVLLAAGACMTHVGERLFAIGFLGFVCGGLLVALSL